MACQAPKIYRQGDVLLIKRDKLPEAAKLKNLEPENNRIILLRGEATGHHHSFVADEKVKGYVGEGERNWLELLEPAVLEHQEHGPITLEPGIYEQAEQVEDDGLQEARQVAD